MKQLLAERLLAKVMDWSDEEAKAELRPLLLLSEVKYDEYHQFGPGMRFIERLGRWLSQLDRSDRATAFRLVRDHLIFVSSLEMQALIGMAYSEYVLPMQRQIAGDREGIAPHRIRRIEESQSFKGCVAKTLYLGLSDGSQMGMLRRMNPAVIDHESTLLTYSMSEEKAAEIRESLPGTLDRLGLPEPNPFYELVVLVDDFTASGTSFIREEPDDFKGKLVKVLRDLKPDGALGKLANVNEVRVLLLFYISTRLALEKIRSGLGAFCASEGLPITIQVDAVHTIDEVAVGAGSHDIAIDDLLKLRFSLFKDEVMDRHYKKGDCTSPHRGFNSGDLPLVLFHNAPNNGLPILWHESEDNVALFPRTTRHGRR